MRMGWCAAAAAALLCAGQASAARYVQFEVIGGSYYDFYNVNQPPGYQYTPYDLQSDLIATFDTTSQPFPTYFSIGDVTVALNPLSGHINTLNTPSGTYFDFTFNPNDLVQSDQLQRIAVNGTYGTIQCPSHYCQSRAGTVFYVAARTTDVAPGALGTVDRVTYTPVPEPMIWAMMILGFGAVGAAVRRRRSADHPALATSRG